MLQGNTWQKFLHSRSSLGSDQGPRRKGKKRGGGGKKKKKERVKESPLALESSADGSLPLTKHWRTKRKEKKRKKGVGEVPCADPRGSALALLYCVRPASD